MISSGGDAMTVVPIDRWDIDLNTSGVGLHRHRRRDPATEAYSRHGRGGGSFRTTTQLHVESTS